MNLTTDTTTPCPPPKEPITAALEDSAVVAAFAAVSGLIATSANITGSVILGIIAASASAGIITYAAKRNIALK